MEAVVCKRAFNDVVNVRQQGNHAFYGAVVRMNYLAAVGELCVEINAERHQRFEVLYVLGTVHNTDVWVFGVYHL